MARLPNSSKPDPDSVSYQGVTLEWIESLPEELKDAALHKWFNAIEANLTLSEFSTIMEDIYHSIASGMKIESGEKVVTKTKPIQKKGVSSNKKMTPRGFSPKK